MKEWISLDQLASYLKISHASLYKMAQRGEIPAAKLGRCWRFDRDTIDQWMQQAPLSSPEPEFPWQDCLDRFIEKLRGKFGDRFASLWVYGSWARGDARAGSDVDLLIVLDSLRREDWRSVRELAYQATFGVNRPVVFSSQVIGQGTFLSGLEPLLLNVRREGKRAA